MTRVILAGAEAHFGRLYDSGVRHMLFSYYYMREKRIKDFARRYKLSECEKVYVMIDSGGYTFNVDPEKHTLEELYQYRDDYIAWLRTNKDYISAAVELDVAAMIGQEELLVWREKYFKPLEDEGITIIYVWHQEDGISGWKEMCQKHKFIGTTQMRGWSEGQVKRYIREAKRAKVKVHGFAYTDDAIRRIEFTTVDSTTWLTGMQWGASYVFNGKKLEVFDKRNKHLRLKYKNYLKKNGIDWDILKLDMSKDKEKRRKAYPEVTKMNILAWKQFGDYVHDYWKKKRIERKKEKIEKKDKKEMLVETQQKTVDIMSPGIVSFLDTPDTPVLKCSSCHISDDCPKFDEKRTSCAFSIQEVDLSTPDAMFRARQVLIKTNIQRLQRNIQFETQSGGYIDRTTQALSDKVFDQLQSLEEGTRAVHGPGAIPTKEQAANMGSMLSNMFAPILHLAQDMSTVDGEYTEKTPFQALPPGAPEEMISPPEALARDKMIAKKKRENT